MGKFPKFSIGDVLINLALCLMASKLTRLLGTLAGPRPVPLWPASGIVLTQVLVFGPAAVAGLALALPILFFASFPGGFSIRLTGPALLFSVGAFVQYLVLYNGLKHKTLKQGLFGRPFEILWFCAVSVVGCALGALIQLVALSVIRGSGVTAIGGQYETMVIGRVAGILIWTPFLTAWIADPSMKGVTRPRLIEGTILFALLLLAAVEVFTGKLTGDLNHQFLLVPIYLWAALRFGERGFTTAIMLAFLVAAWAVSHGAGALTHSGASLHSSVLLVQSYFGVTQISLLLLGVSLKQLVEKDRELVRQSRLMALVLENAGDGIQVCDRKGEVQISNPAMRSIGERTAYLSEMGEPFAEEELPLPRAIQGKKTDNLEIRIPNDADGDRYFLATGRPIREEGGQIEGGVSIIHDITSLKRAQLELRKSHLHLESRVTSRTHELAQMASELKRANAELQDFAFIASHDLQEPLRMVTRYLELIQARCQGKLDPEVEEFLQFARSGAVRMKNLITSLLEMARLGASSLCLTDCDLEEVLGRVLKNLELVIAEKRAEIHHQPLPCILADRSMMLSLFQNLISNALKFVSDGSPRVEVMFGQRENEWLCAIHDNGIGIEPQFAGRIFKMFQRLNSMTEYPGAGIGLAFCKKIVERHGGRIWFESEPGNGTTFHFVIPKLSAPAERLDDGDFVGGTH